MHVGKSQKCSIIVSICFLSLLSSISHGQWSRLIVVDTTTPNLLVQENAATDVDAKGTLGVVWQEETSDRRNPIVFLKSTNQGNSFQKCIVIDSVLRAETFSSPGESRTFHDFKFGPDGTIWVLWSHALTYDYFVQAYMRLSKSTDGGQTFSEVFSAPRASATFMPQLSVSRDGSVYILWDDQQFKCTRFLGGDVSKRLDASIGVKPYAIDSKAGIAVDSMLNVYCSWNGYSFDSTNNLHEYVFCSVSRDSGKTFFPFARVNATESVQMAPKIAVGNSNLVFVAYQVNLGPHPSGARTTRVVSSTSKDGGRIYEAPVVLSDSSIGGDAYPRVIFQRLAGVLTTWTFDRWLGNYDYSVETYFSRSLSLGASFSQPVSISPATAQSVLSTDTSGNVYSFFHASGKGICFSRTNVLTGVEDQLARNVSEQFAISQNYPNPFNSSTLIQYQVPSLCHVKIELFDMLGRRVKSLVDEIQGPGERITRLNAQDLSSGSYFYRIIASGFVAVRKLILLR